MESSLQRRRRKGKHVPKEEATGRRGGEEKQKRSAILQGDTRPDVLRHRLKELTKELGGVEEVEEVERFGEPAG